MNFLYVVYHSDNGRVGECIGAYQSQGTSEADKKYFKNIGLDVYSDQITIRRFEGDWVDLINNFSGYVPVNETTQVSFL